MNLCTFIGHKYTGFTCERCGALTKDRAVLERVLRNGSDWDAAKCAGKLVEAGDYSFTDLMLARMKNHLMAEPLSRIPDERVLLPLILDISKYALSDVSVSIGNEAYSPYAASYIFANLVRNFPDRAPAYLSEIGEYHFFYMKDGELVYRVGRRRLPNNPHLGRPDQVADCARKALESVKPEVVKAALEREKGKYRYCT